MAEEVRVATPPTAWHHNDGGGGGNNTPSAKPSGSSGSSSGGAGTNVPAVADYGAHDKLQTSHRGQYSIERMLALHEYSTRVSSLRALAVCVLTPVPALVIALLLQLLPVEKYNPFMWTQDTSFWIFTVILSVVFTLSVTVQARKLLPTYPISLVKAAIITLVAAAAMVLILYGVGKAWWFPVPFSFVLGAGPFLVIWFGLFGGLVQRKAFPQGSSSSTTGGLPLSRFFAVILTQIVMIAWFAAFEIVLIQLEKHVLAKKLLFLTYQSWRNIFKHTVACYLLRHSQDFVPEMVVFTVELGVSLYLYFEFMCTYDEGMAVAVLGSIFLNAMAGMLHLAKRLKKVNALRSGTEDNEQTNALQGFVDALQRPHLLDASVLSSMRLHGTGGHQLPNELASIVDNLQNMAAFQPAPEGTLAVKKSGGSAVAPASSEATTASGGSAMQTTTVALHHTLAVLFNTEYLVLVRYVELIAPILYVVFVHAVVDNRMPTLISFPYLQILSYPVPVLVQKYHEVGIFVILFVGLQIILGLIFVAILKWKKMKFSLLHQLAFVLENQQLQIQAKLIAYMLFAVHFVMLHYGTDFHVKFLWKAYFP